MAGEANNPIATPCLKVSLNSSSSSSVAADPSGTVFVRPGDGQFHFAPVINLSLVYEHAEMLAKVDQARQFFH